MRTNSHTHLVVLSILFFVFTACAPDKGIFLSQTPTGNYRGEMGVTGGNGNEDFIAKDVDITIGIDTARQTYTILMHHVKFSDKMPLYIDMTISDVHITDNGIIEGDSIVPWAKMLGYYPRYTIKNLNGNIAFDESGNASAVSFSMVCGTYPTTYIGRRQ